MNRRTAAVSILTLALFLLGSVSTPAFQSGRRPPKPPTSPDPLPPKNEEPPIKPSEEGGKSQIPVRVAWYLQNVSSSPAFARIVQSGCLERLSQSNSVKASPVDDINRKRASEIAKASNDTYVLWFELELDAADSTASRGSLDPGWVQSLYVRYEVFAPGTGKAKTSGRIFQRSRGPAGLPLPVPAPGTTAAAEYTLRYAGREMADRLFDALGLPHPANR
jgi:hypothetical protein